MASDPPCNMVSSSGQSSSLLSRTPSYVTPTPNAPSPPASHQGPHHPPPAPTQHPSNPFQAVALMPCVSSDLSSDGEPETSKPLRASSPPSRASLKSPTRAHAQRPLREDEEAGTSAKVCPARLSMMERTHSAPGGIPFGMLLDFHGTSRPRMRLPVSIPEDRAVGPTAPVEEDTEAVRRPIRKVTHHHFMIG